MTAVSPERSARFADRALLLAVVCAAWGWAVALPFQLDDHTFLRALHVFFGGAAWPDAPAQVSASYLFRPVQFLWMGAWMQAGTVCNAAVFHAASVGLHALCVLVLHALCRHWFSRGAALTGAVLFALLPAGGEAITWIAASSDLFATLFALLAVLILVRSEQQSFWRLLGAGFCAALGLLSKESMLAVLPALVLTVVVLRHGRGWRAQFLGSLIFLIPWMAAWIFRGLIMGSFSFRYAGGRSVELSAESLGALIGKIPDLVLALLAPWPPGLEGAAPSAIPKAAALVALLALPLLAVCCSRTGWVALAALLSLWPAPLFAAPAAEGEVFSRSLYMSGAALALCAAAGAGAVLRMRAGRIIVLGLLILALACSADALIRYRRVALAAGEQLDVIQSEVRAQLTRPQAPQTLVVLNAPEGQHTIPMIGSLLPLAWRPPFHERIEPITAFDSMTALFDSEALVQSSAGMSVDLLEFNDAGGVARRVQLPPGATAGHCAPPDAEGWCAFPPGFAPRGAPEIALSLEAAQGGELLVNIETSRGPLQRRVLLSAGQRHASLLFDHDEDWMLAERAVRMRVSGATLAAPPRAIGARAQMEILQPIHAEEWGADRLLQVRLRGLPPTSPTLQVRIQMFSNGTWSDAMLIEVPQARLRREGPDLHWIPASDDRVTSPVHPGLRPESLERMCLEHLRPHGQRSVQLRVRVSALAADGSVEARSPWRQFLLHF